MGNSSDRRAGVIVLVLVWTLALVGCDSKEAEQARAEAQQAKARLAEVTETLTATLRDRGELETSFEKISAELDQAKTQVKDFTKALVDAAAQRNLTEAKLKELTATLDAQREKVAQLQGENSKLRATIKEFEDKLASRTLRL
jgi:chromosome segregation ATPase